MKNVKYALDISLIAGSAMPKPPVSTTLGPTNIDIVKFCHDFNEFTKNEKGNINVGVLVYDDLSYDILSEEEFKEYQRNEYNKALSFLYRNKNKIQRRVNLIIEYIEQILSDNIVIKSKIKISPENIDGKKTLTLNVYVPIRNFEKHFNLDILEENDISFYKYLTDTILNKYMDSETIGISRYYNIRPEFYGDYFNGIDISNLSGSCLKLSFGSNKREFQMVVDEYNNEIDDYIKSLNEEEKLKK